MSVQTILNWLGSSAAPGWIAAVIMLIGLIIQWLRGRERPSRVVVEEILETTLLSPPKAVPEPERVKLLYGDQPIEMLWMTELRVRNAGRIVIPEPDLYIQVDSHTKLLGVQLEDVPPSSELEGTASMVKDNTLVVAYPYLNPFREHRQETTIKVLCDRKPDNLTVEGGGRGWSVLFLSTAKKTKVTSKVKRIVVPLVIVGLISFPLGAVLGLFPDIETSATRGLITWLLGFVFLACSIIAAPILERWLTGRLR
ncbi:MAG TPA: hypothetical protein DCP08_07665 [Chloroflexi bacterium]|nr:hypothetical protein [Chloroflexota bacterium]